MTIRLQFDFSFAAERPPGRSARLAPLAWLRGAVRRWRERRLLEVLDDRMLRDIGISRSQALAEAGKPFWRR